MDWLSGVGGIVNSIIGIFTSQTQFNRSKRLLRLQYSQQSALLNQSIQAQKEEQKFEIEKAQLNLAQSKPYILQNVSPNASFFGEIEKLTQGSNFVYIIIVIAILILLFIIRKK